MVRRSWWRNIRFHQFAGGSGSVTDYRSDCTFDRHRGGPIAWKKCHDCGSLNICVMFCIASFASIYEWTWRKSELWWRPASLKLSFDLDTFIWCWHVKFLFWTRICHVYRWRNTITKSSYANFDSKINISVNCLQFLFSTVCRQNRARIHACTANARGFDSSTFDIIHFECKSPQFFVPVALVLLLLLLLFVCSTFFVLHTLHN